MSHDGSGSAHARRSEGGRHDAGRRSHYRDFYLAGPTRADSGDDRPLWLVVGNCQAEALRQVLDSVESRPFRTVRIPPVHELDRTDIKHLDALLADTDVLLSQPVRADYRGLPLGTGQLAEKLSPAARCVRWPVIRYAGLHPFQAIVRRPANRSVNPPVVPYHDLRTVAAARAGLPLDSPWDVAITAGQVRAVAAASCEELAMRERRDCDVGISDVLIRAGAHAAHTINHPGNRVLEALGQRILDALDVALTVAPMMRTLLNSVHAPLDHRVLDALAIDAEPTAHWVVDGEPISAETVYRAQRAWYDSNPDFLDLAIDRHRNVMEILDMLSPVVPS